MFKRIIIIGIIICTVLVAATACSSGGSPTGVVKAYYKALNAGDLDKAEEYLRPGDKFSESDREDAAYLKNNIKSVDAVYENKDDEYMDVRVEVSLKQDEIIDKEMDNAFGKMTNKDLSRHSGNQNYILGKFNGKWRIIKLFRLFGL